jgi:hypothetical protein
MQIVTQQRQQLSNNTTWHDQFVLVIKNIKEIPPLVSSNIFAFTINKNVNHLFCFQTVVWFENGNA